MPKILASAGLWAVVWGMGGWLVGESRGAVITWRADLPLSMPCGSDVPCSVAVSICLLSSVLIWGTIRGAIGGAAGIPVWGAILGTVSGCAAGLIAFFTFLRIGGERASLSSPASKMGPSGAKRSMSSWARA
jgi:hypothetical protein